MTPQQRRALLIIQDFYDQNGREPHYRELAVELGLKAHSGAYRCVKGLAEQGFVRIGRLGLTLVKRIEPITDIFVWDEATRSLVPRVKKEKSVA